MFALEGKRIWVAGHNGMVGSAIVRQLSNIDSELVLVNRSDLDLRDQAAVHEWMSCNKPEVVFVAAAKVGGILANRDYPAEFIHDNLLIQNNIIHSSYECGVQKLLFLGSSCIYPRDARQPITEDQLLTGELESTNEAYAIAKIAGLKMCESYNAQYGTSFISAMPCNLYGPGDLYDLEKSHVIPALIRKMHEAKLSSAGTVQLWGSGQAMREFLYVDDLAEALIYIMRYYDGSAPINVGSGNEVTIEQLAHLIAEVVGFDGSIAFDKTMPDGTPRKCLDSSKLNVLGWQASTKLKDGLVKAYNWYEQTHGTRYAA